MPLKDSPEAFYESKAPLSFTVTWRGEAKSHESHVGIINPIWCTEWDITPNPLAVRTDVSPVWPPETIEVGLLSPHRITETFRHGDKALYYFTMMLLIDPFGFQAFKHLN